MTFTCWNSFELRMYDPVIGRFIAVDPARQYASGYIGMGNNPVNRIDPTGGVDNPIYDVNTGEFLGTDDKGLQGEAIFIDPQFFTQGMAHEDALRYGIPFDLVSQLGYTESILNFVESHFNSLPGRPDYDGYLTLEDANEWYRNGKGEPLYVNASKVDLTPLTTANFDKVGASIYYNFATPGAFFRKDSNTGLVYGTIKVTLLNGDGKALLGRTDGYLDTYNFEYHDGRHMRNIATWLGKQVAGDGKPYKIFNYGFGKVKSQ